MQDDPGTTPRAARRRRGGAALLAGVVCVAVLVAFVAQRLVHEEVRALVAEAESRWEVHIRVARVWPVSPWRWRSHGVAVYPVGVRPWLASQPIVEVERVDVVLCRRPGERWRWDLCAAELLRPQVAFQTDEGDDGLLAWWRRRWASAQPAGDSPDVSGEVVSPSPSSPELRLPNVDLRVTGGHVALEDAASRWPGLALRVEELDIRAPRQRRAWHSGERPPVQPGEVRGRLEFEGWGRATLVGRWGAGQELMLRLVPSDDHNVLPVGHGLPFFGAQARVSLGALELWGRGMVQLSSLRLQSLGVQPGPMSDWTVQQAWFDRVQVLPGWEGVRLEARDVRVGLTGSDADHALQLATLALERSWQGVFVGSAVLPDDEGNGLHLDWREAADGSLRLEAVTEGYRLSPWVALWPEGGPLVVRAGIATGSVVFERTRRLGRWQVAVDGSARGLDVSAPWLAEGPLAPWDVSLQASIEVDPRLQAYRWAVPALEIGTTTWASVGVLRREEEIWWTQGHGRLEATTIRALLAALPAGVAPSLRRLGLEGGVAGYVAWDLDPRRPSEALLELEVDTSDLRLTADGAARWDSLRAVVPTYRWRTEVGEERRWTEATWVSLSALPSWIPRVILAAEDDRFYLHEGVDVRGLMWAALANLEAGALARGGSTISQQVVKNLLLDGRRTLDRKLEEWVLTWWMERELSKDRILELYLNMARWGVASWGLREAAASYFGRTPGELVLEDVVMLGAILPNPMVFGEAWRRGEMPHCRQVKMGNILRNLRRGGVIDEARMQEAAQRLDAVFVDLSAQPTAPSRAQRHALSAPRGGD